MAQATIRLIDLNNADHLLMHNIDTSTKPHYSVQEVAKVFFGRTSNWLRRQEQEGRLVLDGEDVGPLRHPSSVRYYTISGVEKIAHALCKGGHISVHELKQVLAMVEAQANIWQYR